MENQPALSRYIKARKDFYQRLEVAKGRLDELLESMLDHEPTLQDLARLEGLHAEKNRLFTEFMQIEERFVDQLLASRTTNDKAGP